MGVACTTCTMGVVYWRCIYHLLRVRVCMCRLCVCGVHVHVWVCTCGVCSVYCIVYYYTILIRYLLSYYYYVCVVSTTPQHERERVFVYLIYFFLFSFPFLFFVLCVCFLCACFVRQLGSWERGEGGRVTSESTRESLNLHIWVFNFELVSIGYFSHPLRPFPPPMPLFPLFDTVKITPWYHGFWFSPGYLLNLRQWAI